MIRILKGDCRDVLKTLPDNSVDCCVTSPPYWGLRDYGVEGQIGLEDSPEAFVENMVMVFDEVKRILKPEGTLWLNLGDSYCGNGKSGKQNLEKLGKSLGSGGGKKHSAHACGRASTPQGYKSKDLIGIPWMTAFALRAAGWYLRQGIVWFKPNAMPESVRDRCTKAHEDIFLLSKSAKYYFDADAISEPATSTDNSVRDRDSGRLNKVPGRHRMAGLTVNNYERRNKRSVWEVATKPYTDAHFAVYPPDLIEPCILAGCPSGGTVLDPFFGAGTTGLVADRLGRNCIGVELNQEYIGLAEKRIRNDAGMLAEVKHGV